MARAEHLELMALVEHQDSTVHQVLQGYRGLVGLQVSVEHLVQAVSMEQAEHLGLMALVEHLELMELRVLQVYQVLVELQVSVVLQGLVVVLELTVQVV